MSHSTPLLTKDNLRVYVVHYTRFTERREHMEHLLKEHGLDEFPVRWISEYDREELLKDFEEGKLGDPKKIAAASISLIKKHLLVYKLAAQEPNCWHLVLEDDVLVQPGFLPALARCLADLPEAWEMFFIGEGCTLHIPWWRRRSGKRVYFRGWKPWWRAGGGTSRCTEAYLVNPVFAARLLETSFTKPPFASPIDWLLAEAGYEMHIRSYWAEPPLISQGAFESWTKNPLINTLIERREKAE